MWDFLPIPVIRAIWNGMFMYTKTKQKEIILSDLSSRSTVDKKFLFLCLKSAYFFLGEGMNRLFFLIIQFLQCLFKRTQPIQFALRMDMLKNILKYMILFCHRWGVKKKEIFCLEELKFLMHAKIGKKMLGKDIERTKVFAGIKKIREITLRWFQTKICYRIRVTNSILKGMGVVGNNVCNFCFTERHNFTLSVPVWTHPVLLGQVWDVFEREKFNLC